MFLDTPHRQKPVLFHRKAYSNCLDETEYNHRNYVVLLSHFSDNLNASIKNFQDCIQDLEDHQKFRISRSQKQVLECGLEQLCQQYLERLCKESYYRNALIRKEYNVFVQSYFAKHKRQECPKVKAFTVKSFSQKQKTSQRLHINKQSSLRQSSIYQKKQIKRSTLLNKPMLYQLDLSVRLQRQNFQGSKILSVKKAGINQCRQASNSTTTQKKNSEVDIKGSVVFVRQCVTKEDQYCQLQKINKQHAQSLRSTKIKIIESRVSTNPEQYQKQKGVRYNRMLRMSYMNTHGSSIRNKAKPITYQQQIKMILNISS